MLKKLLKYDLKYIYKSQIFLYGITILCLIIAKLFQTDHHAFFIFYSLNLSFLIFTYAMIFVLIINNLTKLWSRFKNAIYGEESYLIHTLPITRKNIYLSKIVSSIITLTTSTLFIFIVDLIVRDFKVRGAIVYSDSDYNIISSVINQYLNNFQIEIMMWFMLLIMLIALSLIGYFSLIHGHKANRNKLIESIIMGVFLFVPTLVLNFAFYIIVGIFNEGISDFLWSATLTNNSEKTVIIITIIFYIIVSYVYYLLGLRNLQNGIDVE